MIYATRTAVPTAVMLASRCQIADPSMTVAKSGADYHYLKADREDAYGKLLLQRGHSAMGAIALRNPYNRRWYGFPNRTMMFGLISAALRYNIFSRVVDELSRNHRGTH